MRLSTASSVLALCASANALLDTSPFFLASTAQFNEPSNADQLQTSEQVLASADAILSSCPTERYLIVSQPNAHAADIRGCSETPRLCRAVSGGRIKSSFSVAEVVGALDADKFAESIKKACASKGKAATVQQTKLAPLPWTLSRLEVLGHNDYLLGESIDKLHEEDSYTILYLASPSEPAYVAAFAEPLSSELKRDVRSAPVRRADNHTGGQKLSLFDKYQFFTPGIFMGIVAVLVLISILGVGLKAIGSLEVSYGAFDKDMGPSAQKK